ncbi:MAG: hypothetical protein GF310_04815 [candidate division Zixibacteria bacterium]|nr:hypothetical protein [candidate division Zixibacteria bacterium]
MRKLLLLSIMLTLTLTPQFDLIGQNIQSEFESYAQVRDSLDALYDLEKYGEAIDLIKSVEGIFPEDDFELTRSHALFCRKAGLYEECMNVFEAGHKKGYFYFIIPRMKRYEPFAGFERFTAIVGEDARLRKKALEKSKTIMEIQIPVDYSSKKKYPLLIVLHGGGSSIERAKSNWKSEKLDNEFIVAFFQSYMHQDLITFGWRTSDPRAREDIKKLSAQIVKDYSIDTEKIVIGGISAGGSMAFDLAINDIIPVNGVFGVCPGKPQEFAEENIEAAKSRDVKAYILGGERDYYLIKQKEMADAFDWSGLDYKQVVLDEHGHDYPEDFSKWIDIALEFLVQTERSL